MSQPMLRLVGLWQEFQQAAIAVQAPGRHHGRARRALLAHARRASAERTGRDRDPRASSFRYRRATCRSSTGASTSRIEPGQLHRAHGPVGLRQEHARQAAAGLLPAARRAASRSTAATSRHLSANELRQYFGVVPQETRAVLRHDLRQPDRSPTRTRASSEVVAGLQAWPRSTTMIEQLPQGYQTAGRRARRRALRRPEAAHRHRARAAQAAAAS